MKLLKLELQNLYETCGQQMYACALAVTGNRESAEDAVHEAFCRCIRLKAIPQNLKAYLFRSVRNAAVDQLRKRRHEISISDDFMFEAVETVDEMDVDHFRQKVAAALNTLSNYERETIVQHLYADLTFREIADMIDRPLGTVTSWYRRGIDKLRRQLENTDE